MTVHLPGGETELAEIIRLLDSHDVRIETLQLHQPSLDDVFLEKTGRKLEGAARSELGARGPSLLQSSSRSAVARRSATGAFRQRALLFFPMLFPLILFAINGTAISRRREIPGFPTSNYRAFLLAMPFIQGAMFVSINAGTSLARDMETGFLNRLALTPLRSEAHARRAARRGVRARLRAGGGLPARGSGHRGRVRQRRRAGS